MDLTPPTPIKHRPLIGNLPNNKRAGSLWSLRNLCPDTQQPFSKYILDGLILSALSDHGAPKGGTDHCHCPTLCLALGRQEATLVKLH